MGSVCGTCTETGRDAVCYGTGSAPGGPAPAFTVSATCSIAASYSATTQLEPGDRGGSTKQVWTLHLKVKEIERDLQTTGRTTREDKRDLTGR